MILVLLLDIGFGGNLSKIGSNPGFWAACATLAANSGAVVAAVISSPVTLPILAGVGAGLVVAAVLEDDDDDHDELIKN